jgi:hypothetical protein
MVAKKQSLLLHKATPRENFYNDLLWICQATKLHKHHIIATDFFACYAAIVFNAACFAGISPQRAVYTSIYHVRITH